MCGDEHWRVQPHRLDALERPCVRGKGCVLWQELEWRREGVMGVLYGLVARCVWRREMYSRVKSHICDTVERTLRGLEAWSMNPGVLT